MADEGSRFEVTVLGALGASLILVNAIVDFYVAALGATYSAPLAFSNDLIDLGLVNLLFAFLLFVFVRFYSVWEDPTTRGIWSLLISIFAAFSLWTGGGFIVGFVLAFTAGVVGIILARSTPTPPAWAIPAPVLSPSTEPVPSPRILPSTVALATETSALPSRLSGMVWYCRRCECDNPTDSRLCRHCGTPSMVND